MQAQDASGKMEDTMLVTGKSLFGFIHSNQLVAYQKLVPDEINITMIPNQEGGKPGPVPEALDAALDGRDLAPTRTRRPS